MIQLQGAVKRFGDTVAVDGLDLQVRHGEVYGLVGPNGAGKTTTFRLLATLAKPDGGTFRVAGLDPQEQVRQVRKLLGYMPDVFTGYPRFEVREYLDYYGALHGLPWRVRRRRIGDVLDLTDLAGKTDSVVRSLSRGMKQRLALARTLLPDPQVLVLDEPAAGLDPRARVEMRELLRELRAMGKTLLVSSHILPELENLCDRVGFLEAGRLVAEGTLEEIARRVTSRRGHLVRVREDPERARVALRSVAGVLDVEIREKQTRPVLVVSVGDPAPAESTLLRALLDAGCEVTLFSEDTPDLESLFLSVTKGEVR